MLDAIERFGFIEVWQRWTVGEFFLAARCYHAATREGFVCICTISRDCQRTEISVDRNCTDRRNVNEVSFEADFNNRVLLRCLVGIRRNVIGCAGAAVKTRDHITVGNAEGRVIGVDVVVGNRSIVFDIDADGAFDLVAVAIYSEDAEIKRDDIIGIRGVCVIKVIEQRERVIARRCVKFKREHGNIACFTDICIADQRDNYRNAFMRQLAVQFRAGRGKACVFKGIGTRKVAAEISIQRACFNNRAEIGFINDFIA